MLMDRLNTRDMMKRRHWNVEDDTCVLCNSSSLEDRLHLFFTCNFSLRIWNYLGINWAQGSNLSTYQLAANTMRDFGFPFFPEVVFTTAWNIWTIRNAKVFRNERAAFSTWRHNFIHDITLLSHRIKCKFKDDLLGLDLSPSLEWYGYLNHSHTPCKYLFPLPPCTPCCCFIFQ